MSEQELVLPLAKRPRLKFIDMARSIAILLMLEGHFIDYTLGAQYRSTVGHFQNPDFLVYDIWHLIRGYTSPMFLTMTGMVFVYLLYMGNDKPFWNNDRIKKGFRRVLELLFWGYLLTPNGFHILQCIGFGIFGILAFYGLYKLLRIVPLWLIYLTVSLVLFSIFTPLNLHRVDGVKIPYPEGWPRFIQNMIYAPSNRSLFPLTPHLGYTFFGAMIGVILHAKWIKKFKWNIPMFLFGLGVILVFFSTDILYYLLHKLDYFFGIDITWLAQANWLFENQGWVLIVLSILASFEKVVDIKENLFIRIGQNTLSIFVVHMMLLYGCVIRFGLGDIWNSTTNPLNPYEAAIGAALFITTFVLMIAYIVPLSFWFNKILDIILPVRKRFNNRS